MLEQSIDMKAIPGALFCWVNWINDHTILLGSVLTSSSVYRNRFEGDENITEWIISCSASTKGVNYRYVCSAG
ncbi:hypothetical protein CS542_01590 [Pedobacter sp. IW39]|nr:hypothetical protein CS542_01590 [Pedobacter sp. IW39]